jgi:hypothetical protein
MNAAPHIVGGRGSHRIWVTSRYFHVAFRRIRASTGVVLLARSHDGILSRMSENTEIQMQALSHLRDGRKKVLAIRLRYSK